MFMTTMRGFLAKTVLTAFLTIALSKSKSPKDMPNDRTLIILVSLLSRSSSICWAISLSNSMYGTAYTRTLALPTSFKRSFTVFDSTPFFSAVFRNSSKNGGGNVGMFMISVFKIAWSQMIPPLGATLHTCRTTLSASKVQSKLTESTLDRTSLLDALM